MNFVLNINGATPHHYRMVSDKDMISDRNTLKVFYDGIVSYLKITPPLLHSHAIKPTAEAHKDRDVREEKKNRPHEPNVD